MDSGIQNSLVFSVFKFWKIRTLYAFLMLVLITKIIFILLKFILVKVFYSHLFIRFCFRKEWTSATRSAYLWTILKLDIVVIEEKTLKDSDKEFLPNFGKRIGNIVPSQIHKFEKYRDIISKSKLNLETRFRLNIILFHEHAIKCTMVKYSF